MTAPQLIGVAASLSLLAGWRLYASVLAAGLAVRFGPAALTGPLAGLEVLGNPWVLGAAGIAAAAELFADKVAWLDSIWDTVHTLIRPVGGALLALAVVQPGDGALEVVTLLLGGGAALASHAAKAGTRAVVNASPEPFSNVAVSTAEDVVTGGALYTVLAYPVLAAGIAGLFAVLAGALVWLSWRTIGRARAKVANWFERR